MYTRSLTTDGITTIECFFRVITNDFKCKYTINISEIQIRDEFISTPNKDTMYTRSLTTDGITTIECFFRVITNDFKCKYTINI